MDYYLTPERLEELKKELNELKTVRRAEVAERLQRAKELGDLSENIEYQEAREEQSQIENRIAELEEIVRQAALISKSSQQEVAEIGSVVIAAKNGDKIKFTIVGSNEADPTEGKISNESPLGKAFLGHKAGDSITVKTPGGEAVYKIIGIE
jgi:transcription elongation factor GreA